MAEDGLQQLFGIEDLPPLDIVDQIKMVKTQSSATLSEQIDSPHNPFTQKAIHTTPSVLVDDTPSVLVDDNPQVYHLI
jgi:hypothetical protein